MKSVPSLVAASTVGVAATGLVVGKPYHPTPPRPSSNKRKATEYEFGNRIMSPSRPATSSTMRTPNRDPFSSSSPLPNSTPAGPKLTSSNASPNESEEGNGGRSTSRRREGLLYTEDERKDSVSSRGSWMKRLSTIQTSQHSGSPRSSIGPDSPSLTFSNGSSATPILHTTNSSPAQLPPNKLVKRTTSGRASDGGSLSRNGSRSQVPTLRRPATSHQRTANLHQHLQEVQHEEKIPSQDDHGSPAGQSSTYEALSAPVSRTYWRHYFEARATKLTKENPSGRLSEGGLQSFYSSSKRIILPEVSEPPTLLKASMILQPYSDEEIGVRGYVMSDADDSAVFSSLENTPNSMSQEEPQKRPRRSHSMQFSSPTTWISRSSSLRASKRGTPTKVPGKRNVSAPLPAIASRNIASAHATYGPRRRDITDPTIYQRQSILSEEVAKPEQHESARNSSSSPLPPLSRLSSFNLDLSRLGLTSSSSSGSRTTPTSPNITTNAFQHLPVSPHQREHSKSTPSSASQPLVSHQRTHSKSSPTVILHQTRSPRVTSMAISDRASTLIGSDNEVKEFTVGDDDDIDFQSDTVYDSYRTGYTGSIRVRSPALDSIFDDSPPANSRRKSLTINDLVANSAFREHRILEEDEGMSTPIREWRNSAEAILTTPKRTINSDVVRSSPPSFCLATQGFGRLSLEDEEDEDWTRDDDSVSISNPLSHPSSSINSQRISPSIRLALADVTSNRSSPGNAGPTDDRRKSVFDWSEPTVTDKNDLNGNSPRPKTVHGKQPIDARGGRLLGRRGPALHVRSQSVPVVPDVAGLREHSKMAPKFGTWGLGAKGVSEDWDNDFEFDGMDVEENEGGSTSLNSSMLVPQAIQRSQASVVGHVGQIREVCLLVEDLKRLRGLAKEKGLLHGPHASMWREADGIIALAIPDEDETASAPSAPQSPVKSTFRHELDDAFGDETSESNQAASAESPRDFEWHRPSPHQNDDSFHNRRRSVFSPEDDIFGVLPSVETKENTPTSSKRTSRSFNGKDSTAVARSVMEHIHQHRVASDPILPEIDETPEKMPFDTTSLRDLVQKANALSRSLAEIIRKHDNNGNGSFSSPNRGDRVGLVQRESSPAFTRVFSDHIENFGAGVNGTPTKASNPTSVLPRSQSDHSTLSGGLGGGSIDGSPTRGMGQRMHMMVV